MGKKPRIISRAGFTLIELSIVIVIIGLVIGGILVGQDLRKSAEIRKAVTDLEKITTAVNTFKLKYGCVPGDCANITSLFSGTYGGNGNGNGYINNWPTESFAAVDALVAANLIPRIAVKPSPFYAGTYYLAGYNDSWSYFYSADLFSTVYSSTPLAAAAKLGVTFSWSNYASNSGCLNAAAVSPSDSSRIDQKIDDGLPQTGKFFAFDASEITIASCTVLLRCLNPGQNSYQNSTITGCRTVYYLPGN